MNLTNVFKSTKPFKFYQPLSASHRSYCDDKSIHDRGEEGPKPRMVHGHFYPEWRKPFITRPGEWYSNLQVFVQRNPNSDILNTMQRIPDLKWSDVKEWYAQLKVTQQIENQKYLPERVAALGINLGAVHFFTYRSCKVRLRNSEDWIFGDIFTLDLPSTYVDGYYVEAIDCENFHRGGIRYEGLENLNGLNFLKWLSLKNNQHVDVWCLDRIAGQNGTTLEFLDISGCKLCVGGVYALAKMSALKMLIITDPGDNVEVQAALSILEEDNPNLVVKTVEYSIEKIKE